MKRKIKFQEGGEVPGMTAAERRRAALEQARQSRSFESQRRIPRRAPTTSADALRSGAGMAPSTGGSALSRMAPRAGGMLGLLGLTPLAIDAYRSMRDRPRSQEDLDIAEAYRTGRDVREIQAERAAAARPVATPDQMQTADIPGNRATSGAGSPAAERMREIDMQGGDVPGNRAMNPPARPQPSRRAAPTPRESLTADDLNAMVLRLQGGSPPQTETERRLADRMGIAYRKGGMVKPMKRGGKETAMKKGGAVKAPTKKMKTGGKVPAPKKMMKGGITSKPKVKPAKYAKGGMARGCK